MNKKWWFVYNDSSLYSEYFNIVDFIFATFTRNEIPCIKIPASNLKINFDYTLNSSSFLADNVLFWDKNWQVASLLQNNGMHVYNSAVAGTICEDKISTYKILNNYDLIPHTLIYPVKEALEHINQIIQVIKFPMLAKLSESVHGNNVFRLENETMLITFLKKYNKHDIIAFQEMLTFTQKTEVKICSTPNQVLSSYKRYTLDDGSLKSEYYSLSEKEEKMCKQVCQILGLDIAGIDIMYRNQNTPLVCDVNTQPNVLNIYRILGIDVIEKFINTLI